MLLGDVPTDLLMAAKAHVDNVVREFALASSGAASGTTTALPPHLAELIDTVVHRFAEVRQAVNDRRSPPARHGQERTDLAPHAPADQRTCGRGLSGCTRRGRCVRPRRPLLTLESPPQHRIFRRWYVETLITQLRAAARGDVRPPQTFESRVAGDRRARPQRTVLADRATRLQFVTAAWRRSRPPARWPASRSPRASLPWTPSGQPAGAVRQRLGSASRAPSVTPRNSYADSTRNRSTRSCRGFRPRAAAPAAPPRPPRQLGRRRHGRRRDHEHSSSHRRSSSDVVSGSTSAGGGGAGGGFRPRRGRRDYPAEMEPNNLKSHGEPAPGRHQGLHRVDLPRGRRRRLQLPGRHARDERLRLDLRRHGRLPGGRADLRARLRRGRQRPRATTSGAGGCAQPRRRPTPRPCSGLAPGKYYVHVESADLDHDPLLRRRHPRRRRPPAATASSRSASGEQCDHGATTAPPATAAPRPARSRAATTSTRPSPTTPQATANDLDGYAGRGRADRRRRATSTGTASTSPSPGSSITAEIGDGFGGCPGGFDSKLYALRARRATLLVTDDDGGVTPCSKIAPAMYPAATNLAGRHATRSRSSASAAAPRRRTTCSRSSVAPPGCGDGILQAGEQCDPGPTASAARLLGDLPVHRRLHPRDRAQRHAGARQPARHARGLHRRHPARSATSTTSASRSPAPNSLVIIQTSDGLGGCPAGFDSVLYLYDPTGTADRQRRQRRGVGTCSQISPAALPGGDEPRGGHLHARASSSSGNNAIQPQYVVTISVEQPGCGDGIVETGEQCDDGAANGTAGDGCSATCQAVPPWEIEPNDSTATATPAVAGLLDVEGLDQPRRRPRLLHVHAGRRRQPRRSSPTTRATRRPAASTR